MRKTAPTERFNQIVVNWSGILFYGTLKVSSDDSIACSKAKSAVEEWMMTNRRRDCECNWFAFCGEIRNLLFARKQKFDFSFLLSPSDVDGGKCFMILFCHNRDEAKKKIPWKKCQATKLEIRFGFVLSWMKDIFTQNSGSRSVSFCFVPTRIKRISSKTLGFRIKFALLQIE